MKTLLSTSLLLVLATGCGQYYEPAPKKHVAGPQNPGGVFDNAHPQAEYDMLAFLVMRSTLTDVLGVGAGSDAALEADCVAQQLDLDAMCPKSNPVEYLDANADQLGIADYDVENPQETHGPRLLTSGGFKVWMLAASSACGRMMRDQSIPALFPNDFVAGASDAFIDDYDTAFLTLMGRSPSETERSRLDAMQSATDAASGAMWFETLEQRGAAVCTVLLGNLEFLGAN